MLLALLLVWSVEECALDVDLRGELDALWVVEGSDLVSVDRGRRETGGKWRDVHGTDTATSYSTHLDETRSGRRVRVREERRRAVSTEITMNGLSAVGAGILVNLGLALCDLHLVHFGLEVERAALVESSLCTYCAEWHFWHVLQ